MKYFKDLEELINAEIGDYSYFSKREIRLDACINKYEWYTLKVNTRGFNKELAFRCSKDLIEVRLGEDDWEKWEKIESYSYKIKYFWIALLEWN